LYNRTSLLHFCFRFSRCQLLMLFSRVGRLM
jgi:hypothetical protein